MKKLTPYDFVFLIVSIITTILIIISGIGMYKSGSNFYFVLFIISVLVELIFIIIDSIKEKNYKKMVLCALFYIFIIFFWIKIFIW